MGSRIDILKSCLEIDKSFLSNDDEIVFHGSIYSMYRHKLKFEWWLFQRLHCASLWHGDHASCDIWCWLHKKIRAPNNGYLSVLTRTH